MNSLPANVQTFIGCESSYEESRIVIFGAPYDCTSSYRPGSRFAPAAIRGESYGIETFSPYQNKDLEDIAVFDSGDLELQFGSPVQALSDIELRTSKILEDGKIPCMIGGEHLVTLGAVRAAAKRYPKLNIIHFDAHCDLRNEYLGAKLSHATVMRRCFEIIGGGLYQFGIRSGTREEFEFSKRNTFMNRFNLERIEDTVNELYTEPVYFSLDLDVLDPSCFCGTGTPEAGGVSFNELMTALNALSGLKNIVGFDINELSPNLDQSGASTAMACKLLREILLYFFK